MLEIHLQSIGFICIALALVHTIFPKYFLWKKDLASLQLINRQMMQVHTFFIAIMIFLIGMLCVTSYQDLTSTPLGKIISLGLSFFWGIRLIVQFVGYSTTLWKGKIFETIIHVIFAILWLYFTVIFLMVYFH